MCAVIFAYCKTNTLEKWPAGRPRGLDEGVCFDEWGPVSYEQSEAKISK